MLEMTGLRSFPLGLWADEERPYLIRLPLGGKLSRSD